MTIDSLRTPAVLIDKARVVRNLDRMQAAANGRGLRLRPHSKTHKSPVIARWQIERGAVGICCAKLGEAEVFADAGLEDIRVPYPLSPVNADRVVALIDRTRLSFIVDDLRVARAWSDAMIRARRRGDVLVKVDVGFHRCGIDPCGSGAVEMIRGVAALPGLQFCGVLAHAGHAYLAASDDQLREIAEREARILQTLVEQCRAAGIAVKEVSVGATPPARYSLLQDGFTEYRPGNYAYYDRTQVALGAATFDDCALTVMARVVSKPAADRIILDSGSKILSSDTARGFTPAPGYGVILDHEGKADANLLVERLSEEHATVKVLNGTTGLEPGDRVRIVPNHSCVVSNLVDDGWLVEGKTATPLPIAARGRIT